MVLNFFGLNFSKEFIKTIFLQVFPPEAKLKIIIFEKIFLAKSSVDRFVISAHAYGGRKERGGKKGLIMQLSA